MRKEAVRTAARGAFTPHKDEQNPHLMECAHDLGLSPSREKILDEPRYVDAAKRAMNFLTHSLTREDGRLLARYREGEAKYPGLC